MSQKEHIIYRNEIEIFKKLYLLLQFSLADTLGDDNLITSNYSHSMLEVVTAMRSICVSLLPSTTLFETGICCKCPDTLIVYN